MDDNESGSGNTVPLTWLDVAQKIRNTMVHRAERDVDLHQQLSRFGFQGLYQNPAEMTGPTGPWAPTNQGSNTSEQNHSNNASRSYGNRKT